MFNLVSESCTHEGDVCKAIRTFEEDRTVEECGAQCAAHNQDIDAQIASLQALDVSAKIAELEALKK